MSPHVRYELDAQFYGRADGSIMSFDMKNPEERGKAMKYVLAFFLPLIIGAGGGYLIGLALGNWIVGIAVGGTIGILSIIMIMVNLAIIDRERGVLDDIVTYNVDTINNTFKVVDSKGRDVTQYYAWKRDWNNFYSMNWHNGLMRFHVKKVRDINTQDLELVDYRAVDYQLNELKALRIVIWGIFSCFTFIPFLPVIVFEIGERKYPEASYFIKDGKIGYKTFGLLWSIVSLLSIITIILVLVFVK